MGALILARGTTPHRLAFGSFLPTCSASHQDVTFESLEAMSSPGMWSERCGSPLVSISPSDARKLLRGLPHRRIDRFPPHRDFAAVEASSATSARTKARRTFRSASEGKPL